MGHQAVLGSGEVVVVIDDEQSVRDLVRTVLELDGYQVYVALNGPVGLGLVDAVEPAVVVLDVMMPGMDGIEVCRQLDHQAAGVVILTARDDPALEEQCRAVGADRFLTKPVDPSVLAETVTDLATVYRSRRAPGPRSQPARDADDPRLTSRAGTLDLQ